MTEFSIFEELMPKIQALISPPDKNAGSSKEKGSSDLQPYLKRRGKRHYQDYCNACGERGNVVLCANCPASFHLLCHDPPLKETETLNGHWTCNACQSSQKNKPRSTKKPTQRRLELPETSTVPNPLKTLKRTPTNQTQQLTSNEILSASMEDTLSIHLHDSFSIKNESMEEENVGSELDESSDDSGSVENMPVKTESNSEDSSIPVNLEFPLKMEPAVDGPDSVTERDPGDINGLNMDDVWKILGIDNRVKINTVKESNRKASADSGTSVSRKASDHFEMADFIETVKRKQIHVNLTNCDYMLKERKTSDSGDENASKKRPVPKSKRSQLRAKVSELDHATGIKRVFDDMIRDATKINPKQFTLPFEYLTAINMHLLSTEKDHEHSTNDLDSRDLLKLPARKCYYCKGTCLVGQMISCDFCPAHFHLNCLNPPLCTTPDVKWMCPLHPHHVLERVMKNPSSVTELMSWWSKFSVPIDDEDVKSNFIEKIKSHEKRTMNRGITPSSVKIPDIVKYHYKHPPPRIPSLELDRSKSTSIFNNNFTSTRHDPMDRSNNRCSSTLEPATKPKTLQAEPHVQKTAVSAQPTASTSHTNNNGAKKYNLRPFKKAKWKKLLEMDPEQFTTSKKSSDEAKKREVESASTSVSTVPANEVISRSNEICENGIAFEKLPKPVDSSESNLCWRKIENYVIRDINRNFITGGISITTLSEDIRRLLMVQKIKQLTEDLPPSFTPNANPYPLFHPLLKDNIKDTLPDRPKGNVRAVLCPLSHRPLIYMYGHSLSIGLGFSNDICLRNYGNCNFISEDHAVIFYDKVTNTYELINYSEYNTIVDGVCYTCDISRSTSKKSPPADQSIKSNTPIVLKSASRTLKKKPSSITSVSRSTQSKRTGSTITAAETRNSYKKLLNDIDKLVSKSQQEMAAIADEDLNEISKAIKNGPTEIKINQPVEKKVRKVNRVTAKRKTDETNEDPSPTKVPRKIRPPARLVEASEDIGSSNESQKSSKTRPGTSKPRRRTAQTSTNPKTRPRQKEKLNEAKLSTDEGDADDASHQLDQQSDSSDEEYLLGDNFFVNPRRSQCRCQESRQKFPNGRDSSWERTAPLNHGSHIQFGCVEFIFSIVNYPGPVKNRPYIVKVPNRPQIPSQESQESLTSSTAPEKNDLTIKLMSILNLLSTKPPDSNPHPDSFASHHSSSPSSLSSRSCSPALDLQNGHVSNRAESPATTDHIDGQIEITG